MAQLMLGVISYVSLTGCQSLKVDKLLAWNTSDLSTYDRPTDSDTLSNITLPAQIYLNSNAQKDKILLDSIKIPPSGTVCKSCLDWNTFISCCKKLCYPV